MNEISCVISVYNGTNIDIFEKSLLSIINQTLKAKEIIIVKDGIINQEFELTLKKLSKKFSEIKVIGYKNNFGPGYARHFGILNASHSLIAIMDSDDISISERFEVQLKQFEMDPELVLCGGSISEGDTNRLRVVPSIQEDIIHDLRIKSPFNNVTVMFKRYEYLLSGGYPFKRTSEDYQLWIKFIYLGYKVKNLNVVLVNVDFDENALERRSGMKILKDDIESQYLLFNTSQIKCSRFFINMLKYSVFRLSPKILKKLLINKVLRKK